MRLKDLLDKAAPGETLRVYIRKRPAIDWAALHSEWRAGATQELIAARLGVSRRTVIRQFRKLKA